MGVDFCSFPSASLLCPMMFSTVGSVLPFSDVAIFSAIVVQDLSLLLPSGKRPGCAKNIGINFEKGRPK